MPFREENYQHSCFACPELTNLVCKICNAPACEEHDGEDMCMDCHAVLLQELSKRGLELADMFFGPPQAGAGASEWNAHWERVYRARFVLARVRNSRRRKYQAPKPL